MTSYTNNQTIIDLEKIRPRDIWLNEARDFTPWLANNIDRLSVALNMELNVIECEKSVGPFSADIYAENEHGNKIVIENQLEKTDHDHAGKLMTYAANLDAKIVIWLTPQARHEHINLINWYNTHFDSIQCYLVEILTQRIDEKNVTLDLKVICEPNETIDSIKIINRIEDIRKQDTISFWNELINIDNYNGIAIETRNDLTNGFIEMQTSGKSKMPWQYIIRNKLNRAELYFYGERKDIYSLLLSHKEDIECDFGEQLIWITGEGNSRCRISSISNNGLNDKDKWEEIQCDMVNRMIHLQDVIKKYLE